jgi:hypothetical protein
MLSGALAPGRANADTATINFDAYTPGSIHNQDGWSSSGAYDHAVANNTYGYSNFGARSLRMSNAVTSGSFGDQTFSRSLAEEAGETSAENGGLSGGPRQRYFEAQWDFASTVTTSVQTGLSVVASPDRGDGARMSWVQMRDEPAGLAVAFNEYISATVPVTGFIQTDLATGLDRTLTHTIRIRMWFADGLSNDVVQVYVDGVLRITGRSWEDYFRYVEGNPTRTVDSILFRTAGTAAPATAGFGFVIDNLNLFSGPIVQCTMTCYVNATTGNDVFPGSSPDLPKRTIQAAVNQASAGGSVIVAAGTYTEAVNITQNNLTLIGTSGPQSTTIVGPRPSVVPGADTLTFSASDALVDGFTITRAGNSVAEWNDARTQGVTFNGTGNILRNAIVTGNRNGVLFGLSSNSVISSDVTNNRTGVHIINQSGNNILRNNNITNNWTIGVLFRQDLSVGGNIIEHNNITGNWYSQLDDRGNPGGITRTIELNYFGLSPFSTTVQNTSGEPGYAAQIPVAYGGTAVPPASAPVFVVNTQDPNPNGDSGGRGNLNVNRLDFEPWLCSGIDTSLAVGFQPNISILCDSAPPDTTITSAPASPTNTTSATFIFTGTDSITPLANLSFQCRLDAGAWSPCTSPQAYTGLADGAHTFDVRASDPAGMLDPTPSTHTWTVDATPPDTIIITAPPAIDSTSATFVFTGTDGAGTGVAGFACRLDGGTWSACTSPAVYTDLSGGPHIFDMRAVDVAGNTDPSPATHAWTVDASLPNTVITASPGSQSNSATADFSFSGSDDTTPPGSLTFECRLDGSAWGACANPKSYTGLSEGAHLFAVRARDLGGNVDPSPAEFNWTVDLTAPDTTITSGPLLVTTTPTATFTFTGTDNLTTPSALTYECNLDLGGWSACASPRTYTGLGGGLHVLRVRAVDAAGNADATPAVYNWTIEGVQPSDKNIYLPIIFKQ